MKNIIYLALTALGALFLLGPFAIITFLMLWHGMP
jgi:hypothetical protein